MRKSAAARAASDSEATTAPDAGASAPGSTTPDNGGSHARAAGNGRHGPLRSFATDELREDFRLACLSRALDDREILLQKQSRVFFQISGAGHEILLTALARSMRPAYDWFFPYYRDRALVLALGVTPRDILLEAVGSSEDPASGGRQMPCHWGDAGRNIVTQSSPTGSQCLPAVGCAEAGRYIARRSSLAGCSAHGDEITYVSLGEGTTSEGEFWESLNSACSLHLPVLFVVADNGYAISVRASDQSPAPVSELVRGFRGLAVTKMDGWDYASCRTKGARAIARVRAGEGPGLIHARVTRPYSHSSADSQAKYRDAVELAEEAAHDPIDTLQRDLVAGGVLTVEEADAIRAEAKELAARSAEEALAAPRPDPATVTHNVLRLTTPATARLEDERAATAAGTGEAGGDGGEPVVMAEAIRLTLHDLMAHDERIRIFGEDVADADDEIIDQVEGKGGVFGVTRGLQRQFGSARAYNTPLAESNIIGRGVGQAVRGLRPCAEIQFFDYIWPAMQQLRSEAATIRWRSNGAFTCPLVVRVAIGGYLTGGAIWHSQSGESIFAHIPGLLIAFPSRARDAVGLLRSSFAAEDPVLFFEHKHLYRQRYAADPLPPSDWMVPFGRGTVVRPGTDLTIVTWGATVQKSLVAAAELADECAVEVVDLRSISPWDKELVAESVQRTSRLLVVHEDTLTAGFGGEVAAWVAEHCFWALDAPIGRVGGHRHLRGLCPRARGGHFAAGVRHRLRRPGAGHLLKWRLLEWWSSAPVSVVCRPSRPWRAEPSKSPWWISTTSTPSNLCCTKSPRPGSSRLTSPIRCGRFSGAIATSPSVTDASRESPSTPRPWSSSTVRPLPTTTSSSPPGRRPASSAYRERPTTRCPLYTLGDARRLRNHLLGRLEDADAHPEAYNNGAPVFVIVGGGPTGVETAGALMELLDVSVRRDRLRIDPRRTRVLLLDAGPRLLAGFNDKSADYALETLRQRGVEVRLNKPVAEIDETGVRLKSGEVINAAAVVWAGGVSVQGTLASTLGAPAGPGGRVTVRHDLALADHPEVFVIGDAAAVPLAGHGDALCAQLAQVAIQSGRHAGAQIMRRIAGQDGVPFKYKDKGIMATIGRRAAVAQLHRGPTLRGTLGWLAWLGLHILYLIGFRNRIVVIINWTWRYLDWPSGPRLIVADVETET